MEQYKVFVIVDGMASDAASAAIGVFVLLLPVSEAGAFSGTVLWLTHGKYYRAMRKV